MGVPLAILKFRAVCSATLEFTRAATGRARALRRCDLVFNRIHPPHLTRILGASTKAPAISELIAEPRPRIVPPPPEASQPPCCEGNGSTTSSEATETPPPPRRNPSWAELMQRGLEIDVLACPNCGGRLRYVTTILTREAIRRILTHLDLPAEPPALAPAKPAPELDEIAWA